MAETPVYQAREAAPQMPRIGLAPTPIPSFPNEVAGAAMQLGQAGLGFAEKLQHAQGQARMLQAKSAYTVGLDQLRTKYEQDPDFSTAGQRFREEAAKLGSDVAQGQRLDPLHQAEFDYFATHVQTIAGRHVDLAARRNLFQSTRQSLDTLGSVGAPAAAATSSPVERQAIASGFRSALVQAADAGIIAPEEAVARDRQFNGAVDAGEATKIIATDPEHAVSALEDPTSFPWIDPPTRVRLGATARSAAAAHEASVQSPAIEQSAYRLAATGKLDQGFLDLQGHLLSASAFGRLSGLIGPPAPPARDPAALASLLDRAVDDPAAVSDAAEAYSHGTIDRAAFRQIVDVNARFDQDIAEKPWAIDYRRDIVAGLKPREASDPRHAYDQLGLGVAAFNAWLDQNPDAPKDQAIAERDRIISSGRAAAAASARQSLEVPAFVSAPRGKIATEDLSQAAARLRAAHDATAVSDDELVRQAELLAAWRDALQNGEPTK